MKKTGEGLVNLEYPGRLLAVGTSPAGSETVIIYAVTGRSPSSQARRLVHEAAGVWVRPTDEEVLSKGNVDLLVYPAILFGAGGIAASNGKQTPDIRDVMESGAEPVAVLSRALAAWDYEPDAPIYTPRISGCVCRGKAALSVVRRGPDGETLRSYFEVPLRPGKGRFVATYQGPNREPLPCFEGDPLEMALPGKTPRETAEQVFRTLGPRPDGRDFRVAAACVHVSISDPQAFDIHIINRNERT